LIKFRSQQGIVLDRRLGVRPAYDWKILAAAAPPPGHAVVAQRHAAREQERFAEPELVILG